MINIIGILGSKVDLQKIFDNYYPDDDPYIIGMRYKTERKGIIPKSKGRKKKKKTLEYQRNCIGFYIKISEDRILKPNIYQTGNIHIPGCKSMNEAESFIQYISDLVNDFEAYLEYDKINPQIVYNSSMFTAQYQLIMEHVDRAKLAQIITNEYDTFCIFKTDEYPGLKIFYHKEDIKVTIIIHRSMKISFNGANSFEKVKIAHNFINEIIAENQNRILISNDINSDSDFD